METFLPNFSEKSVIVIDNVPFHSIHDNKWQVVLSIGEGLNMTQDDVNDIEKWKEICKNKRVTENIVLSTTKIDWKKAVKHLKEAVKKKEATYLFKL